MCACQTIVILIIPFSVCVRVCVFQRENLKIAQQYFQLVGGSASECDTIPGRQCMASCFFLLKQFDDVLLYLNSIKSYFYNDDTFNFNYAQVRLSNILCLCMLADTLKLYEVLVYHFMSSLCVCYISPSTFQVNFIYIFCMYILNIILHHFLYFPRQAKAAIGDYKEAEEVFLLIQNEKIKNDYVFLSWLARCCEYYCTQ